MNSMGKQKLICWLAIALGSCEFFLAPWEKVQYREKKGKREETIGREDERRNEKRTRTNRYTAMPGHIVDIVNDKVFHRPCFFSSSSRLQILLINNLFVCIGRGTTSRRSGDHSSEEARPRYLPQLLEQPYCH